MARLGKDWIVKRSTEQLHAEMNLLRNKTFRKNILRVKEIRVVRARLKDGVVETSCARPCRHCAFALRHYAKICRRVCGRCPSLRFSTDDGTLSESMSMVVLPEGALLSSGQRRRLNETVHKG